MNLSNYSIINHKINFKYAKYANLQNLLNSNFNRITTLNEYLQELLFIKNNWNNQLMDDFVENKLNDYWNWEVLKAYNVIGKWFTFIGYDDLTGYINVDKEMFYLENEILTNLEVVQMPLDEFIDVLQQWKVILNN